MSSMNFEIVTDSSANLEEEVIKKYNIKIVSLSYYMQGKEYKTYDNGYEHNLKEFYEFLRNKEMVKTSLASPSDFVDAFKEILDNGKDIVCVCISGGVSGTFQSATVAAQMLEKDYPDRTIRVVNSLGASIGVGLLAYYAGVMRDEGKTATEVADYLDEKSHFMRNLFVVDDLFFLNRGGRLSTSSAIIGSIFKIKPLLYGDKDGKVSVLMKVRGRKQSIDIMIDKFKNSVVDPENQIIGITHGDCPQDAKYLEDAILKICKPKGIMNVVTEPVMVTHGGPGMLGLFFIGNEK